MHVREGDREDGTCVHEGGGGREVWVCEREGGEGVREREREVRV